MSNVTILTKFWNLAIQIQIKSGRKAHKVRKPVIHLEKTRF